MAEYYTDIRLFSKALSRLDVTMARGCDIVIAMETVCSEAPEDDGFPGYFLEEKNGYNLREAAKEASALTPYGRMNSFRRVCSAPTCIKYQDQIDRLPGGIGNAP